MNTMAASELNVMETSMMSQASMVSGTGSMSMREKSQLKRRINKEHNSNFRAGYVPVNESYLHKAGIRGRKRLLLYALIAVLSLIVALNFATTVWLLWVYRITFLGMEPMEFSHSSAGSLLRFLDSARFQTLMLKGGNYLGSRHGNNLTFTANDSKIVMSTSQMRNESMGNMVEVGQARVGFSVDDLKLRTPAGGKSFFSLSNMKLPGTSSIRQLHAHTLRSPLVRDVQTFSGLNVETSEQLTVKGSRGVKSTSYKETKVKAKNLNLVSKNGTVQLTGRVVIKFTNSTGIPVKVTSDPAVSAKLCVCARSGLLFTVPMWKPGIGCADFDKSPCV